MVDKPKIICIFVAQNITSRKNNPKIEQMDVKETFGKRLKQARQRAGLTMEALSQLMGDGVSKQTISKYEAGKAMAGSEVLIKLAKTLGLKSIDYFLKPFTFDVSDIELSFRKKSNVGAKEVTALKLKIQDDVERFLEIEKLLNFESEPFNIEINTTVSSALQMIDLAKELRSKWGLGIMPIPSVKRLLIDLGIKVFEIDGPNGFDGISGKANDCTCVIVVNANNKHVERKRFTLMHEIAHLLVNSHFHSSLSDHDKEKLCDVFASEMLLPSSVLKSMFGNKSKITFQELISIQMYYGISVDAIMYSLKRMCIISDKRHRKYCIDKNMNPEFKIRVETSRYNEPSSVLDYNDDIYRLMVYSALAQDLISTSRAAEMLDCDLDVIEKHYIAF